MQPWHPQQHACTRAHAQDRRAALGLVAGTAGLLAGAAPSLAAYGDSANVFGRVTNKSGFVPYAGDSYALLIPSKWNPSTESAEVPNIVLRCVRAHAPPGGAAGVVGPDQRRLEVPRASPDPRALPASAAPSRYADNFDAVNSCYVVVQKSDKTKIEDYGSPEEFVKNFGYLLGKQAWAGEEGVQPVACARVGVRHRWLPPSCRCRFTLPGPLA